MGPVRRSTPVRERDRDRDRVAWRSAVVVGLSVGATGLVLVAGFGFLLVRSGHAVAQAGNDIMSGYEMHFDEHPEPPIPIPPAACPYLRLVATAADHASAPWLQTFTHEPEWTQFSHDLSAPLAELDAALGAAIPHLPAPIAQDFGSARAGVAIGRAQLLAAHTLREYRDRIDVGDGSFGLNQTEALSGNQCGDLSP
jgi:hypothetical protein